MAHVSDNEDSLGKRKADSSDENDDNVKKKMLFDPNFTEIEFKARLRDTDTITSGLEDFLSLAVAYADGVECTDIVSSCLTNSPECAELLGLLNITQNKLSVGQVSLVFRCLTQILKYVQLEPKFKSTGEAILQRLLSAHLGQMYNYMRGQNKSGTVKSTVQLLIALVMLGDKAKKAVQSKFNFDHEMFQSLFLRRNRNDPEDVRSCLVLFTMSFIVEGNGELINAIVQQKGFIQLTVAGLMHDSKDIVLDVLATLLDKIVKNPDISKTAKIKLFSEKVLKQVCELYEWEGPRGWSPKKDKRQEKAAKEFLKDEDFLQERAMVSDMVHEFLLTMCCSQKFGIVFFDRTFGTGIRNMNLLLTHLLEYLAASLKHPLKRALAVRILKACPDQLYHFLSSWAHFLVPGWSDKWATSMNFLMEVYDSLSLSPSFLTSEDHMVKDVDTLVSMMTLYYLPSAKVASCLALGVRNNNIRVRHYCLMLTQVIVRNTNKVLSNISKIKIAHDESVKEILCSIFKSLVIKAMPPPPALFVCVEKFLNLLSCPKKLEDVGVNIDLTDHMVAILKTLKLYQRLCPALLSERPKDVAKLVEAVGKLEIIHDPTLIKEGDDWKADAKVVLPQLDLLKLLADTDVKTLRLGREGLLEKLMWLAHQCSREKQKEKTISLITKMLTCLDVLSPHQAELQLWMDVALTYENSETKDMETDTPSQFSPIGFLSVCLCTLINNPAPYVDLVLEVVAEASNSAVSELEGSTMPHNNGLKDSEIQAILNTSDEELVLASDISSDNGSGESHGLPFSPLTSVAVEKLHYFKGDQKVAAEYISAVIIKVLHTQVNPQPFSQIVTSCSDPLPSGVKEYFLYWAGDWKKSKTFPLVDLKMSQPFPCRLLNWFLSGEENHLNDMKDVKGMSQEEKRVCLTQAIFYLEHCLSATFALGQKMKRGKFLRKTIENIFVSYIKDAEDSTGSLHSEQMECAEDGKEEMDAADQKEISPVDNTTAASDDVCEIFTCILNNPTFKNLFLTSPSSSIPETSDKFKASVSKLLCNVLLKSKGLNLPSSCHEILREYLDKALTSLTATESNAEICLPVIEVTSSYLDLHAVNKCVSCFLEVPKMNLFEEDALDGDKPAAVPKGQSTLPLSSIGETFVQTLKLWVQILKQYKIVEKRDNSVLFSKCADTANKTPCAEVWLDVSMLKPLFELLAVCSNFDTVLCNLVQQFPEIALGCSPKTFKSLLTQFSALGLDRRALAQSMIASLDVFHKLAEIYLEKHTQAVVKSGQFSLLTAYLERQGDTKIRTIIYKNVLASCSDILSRDDETVWSCLQTMVSATSSPSPSSSGTDDEHFCRELFSAVHSHIKNHLSSVKSQHFSLLKAICQPALGCSDSLKESEEFRNELAFSFLDIVLKHFMYLVSKKSNRNEDLETCLVCFGLNCLENGVNSSKMIYGSWAGFVKSSLKHLYASPAVLKLLSLLSNLVYANYKTGMEGKELAQFGGLAPQTMFEMCVSHTAFLSTLCSTSDVLGKEALVRLLFTLYTIEPSCVKKELVSPFMGAYSASLSLTDQRLLKMIQTYLTEMENNEGYPVLWGKAYLDHKANTKTLGPSLEAEIAMKVVLAEIEFGRMQKSLLHYPFRRNTKTFDVSDSKELMCLPECYDPCFFLRVFRQLLSPARIVPVRSFVAKDCLSFLLISLTSHNMHCRLLAYQCLNEFYGHLENSGCLERNEFAFVLDILNASRVQNAQKLSYIVALFFTRAVKLIIDPADHMYLPILRFLLLKPEMDLNGVPEFYNLFFSAGPQYVKERNWMLSLLRDGIRESSDYWIYQKRQILRLLMSFYSSSLSDKASQVLVLEVVRNMCRQRPALVDMIMEHGLIPWLGLVVSGLKDRHEHVELTASILKTLCTCLDASDLAEILDTTERNLRGSGGDGEAASSRKKSEKYALHSQDKTRKISEKIDIPECVSLGLGSLIRSFEIFTGKGRVEHINVKKHFLGGSGMEV